MRSVISMLLLGLVACASKPAPADPPAASAGDEASEAQVSQDDHGEQAEEADQAKQNCELRPIKPGSPIKVQICQNDASAAAERGAAQDVLRQARPIPPPTPEGH